MTQIHPAYSGANTRGEFAHLVQGCRPRCTGRQAVPRSGISRSRSSDNRADPAVVLCIHLRNQGERNACSSSGRSSRVANDLVVGYLPNSVISRGRSLNSVLGRRSHSRAFNKMAIMKVPSFERAPTVAVILLVTGAEALGRSILVGGIQYSGKRNRRCRPCSCPHTGWALEAQHY